MVMHSTRFFFILLFFSLIVSCDNNEFLSSDYDFPIDSIKGTTIFEWDSFHGDSLFTTFKHQTLDFRGKDTFLIKYSYVDHMKLSDSSVFLIRDNKKKLIKQWMFFEDDYDELITMESKRIVRQKNFERIVSNSFFLPFLLNAEDRRYFKYDTLENGQLLVHSEEEASLRLKLLNIPVYKMTYNMSTIMEKNIGAVEIKTILEDKPLHFFLDTIYHKY